MTMGRTSGHKPARGYWLVCWLAWVAAACVPGGVLQRPVLPQTTAITSPQASGWYQLFFTNPVLTSQLAEPDGGVPDQIAAAFDGARTTIDLAIYQFDLKVISAALLRAQTRGVRVRVVTDSDSLNMDGIV